MNIAAVMAPEKGPVALKRLRFVEIHWLDAAVGDSWAPLHGDPDVIVAECRTRGWIIKEDDRQVVVCATLSTNSDGLVDGTNTSIAIPRGMLVKLTDFPNKRPRTRPVQDAKPAPHDQALAETAR